MASRLQKQRKNEELLFLPDDFELLISMEYTLGGLSVTNVVLMTQVEWRIIPVTSMSKWRQKYDLHHIINQSDICTVPGVFSLSYNILYYCVVQLAWFTGNT